MHLHHILEQLTYHTGEFPRDAIEAAVARKEEITPYLLKILEETLDNLEEILENDDYQGHLYALYLLAQFREKRAFPLVIKLFSFPGDIPQRLTGDVVTEDLEKILASLCGQQVQEIYALIENPHINEYVRAAAQSALVTLVGCGLRRREEVVAYFKTLFHGKLERRPSFAWSNLILSTLQLYPKELFKEIEQAYAEHLPDPIFVPWSEVKEVLASSEQEQLLKLFQNSELIEDTVIEMEKWDRDLLDLV